MSLLWLVLLSRYLGWPSLIHDQWHTCPICVQSGVPVAEQSISYEGRELSNPKATIRELGVQGNSAMLLLRRKGAPSASGRCVPRNLLLPRVLLCELTSSLLYAQASRTGRRDDETPAPRQPRPHAPIAAGACDHLLLHPNLLTPGLRRHNQNSPPRPKTTPRALPSFSNRRRSGSTLQSSSNSRRSSV